MRRIRFLFFCLTLAVLSGPLDGHAQVQVKEAYFKPDPGPGEIWLVPNEQGWKYHSGDEMAWADPYYDDSGWVPLPAWNKERPWLMPEGVSWTGVGWFRLRLKVGPKFRNKALALVVFQSGASEIYLDGKQVFSRGRVGQSLGTEQAHVILSDTPEIIPVRFGDGEDHVLAVRFSNFEPMAHVDSQYPVWWGASVAELQYSVEFRDDRIRQGTVFQTLSCVPMAFALLHFLFYLFYRELKGNLCYAAFAASITLLIYLPFEMSFVHQPDTFFGFDVLFKIIVLLTVMSSLKFYYMEFFKSLPGLCRSWFIIGGLLVLSSWAIPRSWVYGFALLSFPELIRIVFLAIKARKPGSRIIGGGIAFFIAACAYQMVMEIGWLEHKFDFPYVYGIQVLVVSMSVYLAYTFGQTNKKLEEKVKEVRKLYTVKREQEDQVLKQERRAQEAETLQKLLEADNAIKEKELEEAQKRQHLMNELETTNQELRTTQSQLVQSEKMAALGTLVAGIAHEINTPVGAINSMHDTLMRAVNRLREGLGDEEGRASRVVSSSFQVIEDANRVIATGTERVTQIVRSLRNFARLDEAEMKEADLEEGIESTLTLVHHHLKGRIEVVKRYGDIPMIVCYPSRLNQVFVNLLVNAAQAIEGEGVIEIETGLEGAGVYVMMKDDGKGISGGDLDKIFDPGFTTKGVGVGTGLGLSICYQIVEDHRGEIRVESEVGKGTTFTIFLPVNIEQNGQLS